jgi:Na+-driven multidrug efflux pump
MKYFVSTLKFSIPIIFSRAGSQILTLLNLAMIGQYGSQELSVFGLTSSPYFTLILIALCLTSGLPIAIARSRENPEILIQQLKISFWYWMFLMTIVVLLWLMFGLFFSDHETSKILFILAFAVPAFIGVFLLSVIVESLGMPQVAAIVTVIAIPLNYILNKIFISIFEANYGAAFACTLGMTVTRWAMSILICGYLIKSMKSKNRGLDIFNIKLSHTIKGIYDQLTFGAPIALSYGLRSSLMTVLTVSVVKFGRLEVAAFTIMSQMLLLGTLISRGVSSATIIKVSSVFEKNNTSEIRTIVTSSIAVVFVLLSVLTLPILLMPILSLKIFTNDMLLINNLRSFGALIVLLFLIDGIANILIGVLRPIGDRWLPQAIFGLSIGMVLVYMSVVPTADFADVIQALLISQAGALIMVLSRVYYRLKLGEFRS